MQPCMRPKPGKPGKPGHPHRTVHISLPGSSTASMLQDPLILLHGLLVLDLPSCSRQKKTFLQSSLNCQKMSGCLFVPDVVCLFASDDADRGYTLLYLEDTTERRSPNSSPLICVPGLIYLLYFLFSVLYLPIVVTAMSKCPLVHLAFPRSYEGSAWKRNRCVPPRSIPNGSKSLFRV